LFGSHPRCCADPHLAGADARTDIRERRLEDTMKTIGRLATAVFLVVTNAHAARPQPAPRPDTSAALIREFRAHDWTRRRAALEELQRQPSLLSLDQKKQILTEVVERDNREIDGAFREGSGASRKFGESYGEYAGRLAEYLFSMVDVQDVDALAAIAQTPYHYNSVLARQLAAYGDVLVPTVLELAASDISPKRWQALGLAGEIHRLNRQKLAKTPSSAASLSRLKEVLTAGARNENITIRKIAVRNLGIAGLPEFLPLLESMADTDPGVTNFHATPEYPVRDEARKAIARIRSGG
jgi:hypothetical protein